MLKKQKKEFNLNKTENCRKAELIELNYRISKRLQNSEKIREFFKKSKIKKLS